MGEFTTGVARIRIGVKWQTEKNVVILWKDEENTELRRKKVG